MMIEELEPLEDPRNGNAGRHYLHDIMVIALCTMLCGGETHPEHMQAVTNRLISLIDTPAH